MKTVQLLRESLVQQNTGISMASGTISDYPSSTESYILRFWLVGFSVNAANYGYIPLAPAYPNGLIAVVFPMPMSGIALDIATCSKSVVALWYTTSSSVLTSVPMWTVGY